MGVPFAMNSRQGLAANMLPVVIDIAGMRIGDLLESIDRQIAEGIEHRRSSFGTIINAMTDDREHLRPPVDAVRAVG